MATPLKKSKEGSLWLSEGLSRFIGIICKELISFPPHYKQSLPITTTEMVFTSGKNPEEDGLLRKSSMGSVAKRRRFGVLAPTPRHFLGLFYFDRNRTKSGPAFGVGSIAVGLICGMPTGAPMFHAGCFVLHIRTFLSHSWFGHGVLLWDQTTATVCQNPAAHGECWSVPPKTKGPP